MILVMAWEAAAALIPVVLAVALIILLTTGCDNDLR